MAKRKLFSSVRGRGWIVSTLSGDSLRGSSPCEPASSSRSAGEMVSESHCQPVADRLDHTFAGTALAPAPGESLVHDVAVGRRLGRFEQQGRVGGAVLGLQAAHRFEVARIGDDDRHGAQLVELGGHRDLRGFRLNLT
jgi:hypothetical protein